MSVKKQNIMEWIITDFDVDSPAGSAMKQMHQNRLTIQGAISSYEG